MKRLLKTLEGMADFAWHALIVLFVVAFALAIPVSLIVIACNI